MNSGINETRDERRKTIDHGESLPVLSDRLLRGERLLLAAAPIAKAATPPAASAARSGTPLFAPLSSDAETHSMQKTLKMNSAERNIVVSQECGRARWNTRVRMGVDTVENQNRHIHRPRRQLWAK